MKKISYLPVTLLTVAILAGCSTPKNSSLTDARNSYNTASSNSEVARLAAVELKEAGDALNKADHALKNGEKPATVNQLAYIAKQKVAIAEETAKRKSSEQTINSSEKQRDQIRLEARTAEADAAKQQAEALKETTEWQAAELAAANVNAERDQATIAQQQQQHEALLAQQEMQLKQLNEAQNKELNAKKTERGLVITLGDLLFGTNKAELKAGGARKVQKLADFLKQYPQQKLLIEGHTDSVGSDSHNKKLSERRANAVRMALIEAGVSGDRVITRGFGEEFPVASNDTSESRQMNRRVEVILSDEDGNVAQR